MEFATFVLPESTSAVPHTLYNTSVCINNSQNALCYGACYGLGLFCFILFHFVVT